jgi:hypothetical protein
MCTSPRVLISAYFPHPGAGLITWLVNGVQVVGMLGLGSLAVLTRPTQLFWLIRRGPVTLVWPNISQVAELLPVVSWGGTRYCVNLGVVPALPAVDRSPAYALQLPRDDKD